MLRVELPRGHDPSGSLLLRPDHPLSADVIRMQFGRRGPMLVLHGVPVADGQFRARLDNGPARELLAGLHQSGRLFVAASPPGRTRPAPLAALRLAGAGVALDWIGRVHRRPADPGGAIAAAPPVDPDQPPPPEMPPSVVKALPAVQSCAALDSTQPGQANAGQRLPGGAVLWRIPCGSGNFSQDSLFVLQRGTGVPVLATFPAPVQFPVRAPGMLVNAAIDADGSLVAIEPSRGLNDCGDVRRYRWDGVRFYLVLAQLMSACHGLPPEEWPVVYRAAGN